MHAVSRAGLSWVGGGPGERSSKTSYVMSRGALIVFEGCDRVGKSTQCRKLIEALTVAGKQCQLMHFPGNN